MTLIIDLSPELEKRLQQESKNRGVDPPEVVRRLLESALPDSGARNQKAIDLLNQWEQEGDESEQRETLEALKQGLNAHYSSSRTIFP